MPDGSGAKPVFDGPAADHDRRLRMLAHDLRNAVQPVSLYVGTIPHVVDRPDEVLDLVQRALRAVAQAQARIAAALEPGDAAAAAPLDCAEVLHRRADELGAPGIACQVVVEAGQGVPPSVACPEAEFVDAVRNLVLNAAEAGARTVVVSCDAAAVAEAGAPRLAEYAVVRVADDGRGMDQAMAARLGEAGFTTKPEAQGHGLGVAGVRSFAERHGGWLDYASGLGQGTTVSLWLRASPRTAGGPPPELRAA